MRSRAARLSCGAVAWIAIGCAAFFLFHSEQQLAALRAEGRIFDLRAREVTDALSDLRAAQQAYVAAGQGVDFWMPKVAQTAQAINRSIELLAGAATSPGAHSAVDDAVTTLAEFSEIDTRVRDYVRSGQLLMAGDVIFSEGDQSASSAAQHIESARLAEHQALDAAEAGVRRLEVAALAAAGAVAGLIVLLLSLTGRSDTEKTSLSIRSTEAASAAPAPIVSPNPVSSATVPPVLKSAAQLCTDFACIRDVQDLQQLLARASDIMDASGLVVWLENATRAELQPVLSHGYKEETQARLPTVPRNASNAAAAAYRSGDMQIILSRPGASKGAIVAPILGAHGCMGALSAEIRGGGEASESVQALAAIIAAQLGGVLAPPSADVAQRAAASS